MHEALQNVLNTLSGAKSYGAIFGSLIGRTSAEKKLALRKRFGDLARSVHPDHCPSTYAQLAADTFQKLNETRRAAEVAIEAGTYDAPISKTRVEDAAPTFDLVSPGGTYRMATVVFAEGDFSTIYRGKLTGKDSRDVLVKIAREPQNNPWLEKETIALKTFHDPKQKALLGIKRFVPDLVETFLVPGEKGIRYRVLAYSFVPDLVSLSKIIEAYPTGLDPRDAVWIYRRVIAQTLAADMAGYVHTAITPDHVLVDPFKHEPLHIGWAHALKDPRENGERVTHIVDRWRDLYPPEVFDKKSPDHVSDIYMAGATMVRLLGGNVERKTVPSIVPDRVASTILKAIEPDPKRRPQDGRQYFDEFTKVIAATWGRKYRPLELPF